MKKVMAMVTVLVLILCCVPALADNVRTSGLYTYEIKGNGTVTITDFDWNANGKEAIFIPNLIDGYAVTGIGDEAFARDSNAWGFDSVAVTLPDGIVSIGRQAFAFSALSSINIPDKLQAIGEGAFRRCGECQYKVSPSQESFAVIEQGLYNKGKKERIAYSWNDDWGGKTHRIASPQGIERIGAYAFEGVDDEKLHIELPSSIIYIGDYAFSSDKEPIDEISGELPNCREIGKGAFKDTSCFNTQLIFSGLERIGEEAFSGSYLTKPSRKTNYAVDFTGSKISEIPDNTFKECHMFDVDDSIDFAIPTQQLSIIGKGNGGLGIVLTSISGFSPLLITIPSGLNPNATELPATITTIESAAFTQDVTDFKLSASVEDIAVDAFTKASTFIVESGSYAELWCSENGYGYSIEGQDKLDWLNN